MHETLFEYIRTNSSTPLTESDMSVIRDTFVPSKLRKRQYFLQEGNVCKYGGFIVKGAMRQYSVDDKGVEHIIQLYIENYWASDRESAIMLTPSKYYIEAWEDTELLIIKRPEMLELMQKIPSIAEMTRVMDERSFIASQR